MEMNSRPRRVRSATATTETREESLRNEIKPLSTDGKAKCKACGDEIDKQEPDLEPRKRKMPPDFRSVGSLIAAFGPC